MNEYKEICSLVCTNIYKAIAKKAKGHIVVYAKDEVINVKIEKDDFTFDYKIYNLDAMILGGYNPQAYANVVIKAYTDAILKKYLRD